MTLIDEVIQIVKDTAHSICKKGTTFHEKGSISEVVTEDDLKIQERLVLELSKLIPDCGFYCEEKDFICTKGKEYIFIIDPIDGTMNYTRGIRECAISVALLKNNELILGVVFDIFKDEVYYAIKGKGAYYQGKKIKVSNQDFAHSILCTGFSLYEKSNAKICFELNEDLYMRVNDMRRFGSAALELCYLAKGDLELYFAYRVHPYDFAAGELILKEAGGCLSSLHNRKVSHDKPQLLLGANNKENLNELNEVVSSHIKYVNY